MTHHTSKGGYRALMDRVNKFPQGAPPSKLLFKIFSILFTEEEAALLSQLPLRPFSAAKAARIWKVPEPSARATLEKFASRAMLLDLERDDETLFILPPPMAGFFEFSLMRLRSDIDQKKLAGLFFQYINVDDSFVRELFAGGETSIVRILVSEPAIDNQAYLSHRALPAILGAILRLTPVKRLMASRQLNERVMADVKFDTFSN